jgi:hypothetical protein
MMGRAAATAAAALAAAALGVAGCGAPRSPVRVLDGPTPLAFTNSAGAYTEIPPWSEAGPLVLTTAYSFACAAPADWLHRAVALDATACALATRPAVRDAALGFLDPAQVGGDDWRRDYDGLFSAHRIGAQLVAVRHGEDKNESGGGFSYQNTVNLDVTPSACQSGPADGGYQDCATAYNAFVTLAAGADFGALTDAGPIVWPSAGYLDGSGAKVSQGVLQPTSIVDGGFLYVFYVDSSEYSVKVARAPVGDLTFTCWGGGAFAQPCLPSGFDRTRVRAFYAAPGPAADPLFDLSDSPTPVRFAVARAGGGRYLGVEETALADRDLVALRVSRDLVHWSARVVLDELTALGSWDAGRFHYPIFVSRDGASNTDVDPRDFYLLATRDFAADHATVVALHLAVDVAAIPVP